MKSLPSSRHTALPRPPRRVNKFAFDVRDNSDCIAMSTITSDYAHSPAEHAHAGSFWSTYVFSRDHKIIGIQFLFSTLIWFFIGGMLALGVRWQLAWPWSSMPILGKLLFAEQGGQIAPETYTMLFTMHATVMVFLVIIPIRAGAFGN